MLGSGGEFRSGHEESKVVGDVRDSAGSAAGLPGLAVSIWNLYPGSISLTLKESSLTVLLAG